MANFYKRLSYSLGNEDWDTEKNALQLKKEDRVLAITASGDRPLNLLSCACKEVVTIDANPFQTALFDMKRAAMRRLSYQDYLAFLGILPSKERLKLYKRFESDLSKESIACWRNNQNKIAAGVIYQGAVERGLQKIAFFANLWQGKKLKTLFSFNDIEEQREFLKKGWKMSSWKKVFKFALDTPFARLFNDPGLYYSLDDTLSPSEYLYTRMENSFHKFLAKENIIASLFFQGKISERAFSPYLTEEGFYAIKKKIEHVEARNTDILSYLKSQPANSFSAFSLSDIASYMKKEDFHQLCYEMQRVGKEGARFCLRQFMCSHDIPETLQPFFKREGELEKRLEEEDRCFVYRFKVGSISKR